MKHLLALGIAFVGTFVAFSSVLHPLKADAALTLATKKYDYFGGPITKVVYCTCVYYPGVVLTVKDRASKGEVNVMYSFWLSKLYENYNIWEQGPNVIGGFQKGGSCLNQKGYYCTQNDEAKNIDGTIDWVRGVGSSANGYSNGVGGLNI